MRHPAFPIFIPRNDKHSRVGATNAIRRPERHAPGVRGLGRISLGACVSNPSFFELNFIRFFGKSSSKCSKNDSIFQKFQLKIFILTGVFEWTRFDLPHFRAPSLEIYCLKFHIVFFFRQNSSSNEALQNAKKIGPNIM